MTLSIVFLQFLLVFEKHLESFVERTDLTVLITDSIIEIRNLLYLLNYRILIFYLESLLVLICLILTLTQLVVNESDQLGGIFSIQLRKWTITKEQKLAIAFLFKLIIFEQFVLISYRRVLKWLSDHVIYFFNWSANRLGITFFIYKNN
jgi:hypothetical protein